MDDKSAEIMKRLEEIENHLKHKSSKLSRVLELIEKLLIPFALCVLAFIANHATNKFSDAQLELAKGQNLRQESESKDNLQLKYIELFYQDITSRDVDKQAAALSLLRLMKPAIGELFAHWVQSNSKLSPELRAKAESIGKNIASFGVLGDYKIGIYFLEGRQDLSKVALDIQSKLIQHGFTGLIQLYPKDKQFFDLVVPPEAFEIRYESEYEEDAANLLETILKTIYPAAPFEKKPVWTRTTNFISIFLGP